jgi:hypothetical protein
VRNIIIGAAVALAIAAAIFVELCAYAEIASQAERALKEGITEDERHGVDEYVSAASRERAKEIFPCADRLPVNKAKQETDASDCAENHHEQLSRRP